jgi:hypothetical protein
MTAAQHSAAPPRLTFYTLALNFLPLAQLLLGVFLISSLTKSSDDFIAWSLAWIYLLPPLACRLTLLAFGIPQGRGLTQQDRAYKVWWFTYQWQVLFNRLPWLEEILRLVPGLYALWLFLWGGRVSPLAYWAPGSIIIDRPLVIVEAGAVIGGGAGLVGHVGRLAPDGSYCVDIGRLRVSHGAMMGARSGLSAGAELASHQMLPAGRLIKPFTRWDGTTKQDISPHTGDINA